MARRAQALVLSGLIGVCAVLTTAPAAAQTPDRDEPIRQAREAFQKRDRNKLASLRNQVVEGRHPLAPWVDYWELNSRLFEVGTEEVDAFYARWPGSYVEDRLRNDWLLELGRRRNWAAFTRDHPRFRMNDDREVQCYALQAELEAGRDVREAALRAWMVQKEADNGCQLLAQTLFDKGQISKDDVWRKIRHAVEHNRQRQARSAAGLLGDGVAKPLAELMDNPATYLKRRASAVGQHRAELTAAAIARLAASDPEAAASQLSDRWDGPLGAEHAAWAWAITAKQGALALHADSLAWSRKAWERLPRKQAGLPDWSDETLGWHARAALRLGTGAERWNGALQAIEAMSTAERNEAVWQYWRARAHLALA
ncbi:MAG: lytic transglycosylase domain-containing protein, partial [Ideonella sp.]